METNAGVSLVARIVRALRLDPTLYQEVTALGNSNRQAVALILITAVIWGLQAIVSSGTVTQALNGDTLNVELTILIPLFVVPAAAQVASWLIWAAGIWVIASRWTPRDREVPFYGQIARALAFAQAPVVLAAVIAVPVTVIVGTLYMLPLFPEGIREDVPILTISWISGLVMAWVLIGTVVAVREALGLSNGRTLLALLLVNLASAALLAVFVVALSGVAGRDSVGLWEDWVGFRFDRASAVNVAHRLNFNFGFIGISDHVLHYLSRSILHVFAGVSGV